MGKKYVDASAEYTEPVSSGKKHMRGDAVWVAPDTNHKFADAEAGWTVPEMYPPTEFPTETIDTPEKLKQALIAVSQGKRPALNEGKSDYAVGISIPTSRTKKLDDDDSSEITLNASIVGFNDFMPNSMTIAIRNYSSGFSCGGGEYSQEINKGIYHIEDKVPSLSTFSLSYGSSSSYTFTKVPTSLSTPQGMYDNILQPYYSDWETAIFTEAKNSGWKQYFRPFSMNYGVLTANVPSMSLSPDGGAMRLGVPSSTSLSERSFESYFHVGDPSDSYTLSEMNSCEHVERGAGSNNPSPTSSNTSNIVDFSKSCRNELYKNVSFHEYEKRKVVQNYYNIYNINSSTSKPYGWEYAIDNQSFQLAEDYYRNERDYLNRYLIYVVPSTNNNSLTSLAVNFDIPTNTYLYGYDLIENSTSSDTYGKFYILNYSVLAVVAL